MKEIMYEFVDLESHLNAIFTSEKRAEMFARTVADRWHENAISYGMEFDPIEDYQRDKHYLISKQELNPDPDEWLQENF